MKTYRYVFICRSPYGECPNGDLQLKPMIGTQASKLGVAVLWLVFRALFFGAGGVEFLQDLVRAFHQLLRGFGVLLLGF